MLPARLKFPKQSSSRVGLKKLGCSMLVRLARSRTAEPALNSRHLHLPLPQPIVRVLIDSRREAIRALRQILLATPSPKPPWRPTYTPKAPGKEVSGQTSDSRTLQIWEFPKIRVPYSGGPYNKDPTI